MPRGEAKIFECVACSKKYSKQDAERGRYFILSGMCKRCLRKMAKSPAKIYCFGKVPVGKLPGYSQDNEVCQKLCPDVHECKLFITRSKGEKRGTSKEGRKR